MKNKKITEAQMKKALVDSLPKCFKEQGVAAIQIGSTKIDLQKPKEQPKKKAKKN